MLFDSTVRRELARSFSATLVVILTIVLTMFLIRTVGQAASGMVSPQDVVLLLGYVALSQLPTMLALSMFVAVVLSLGRMYRDSEMAIWFASGIGLSRFVRPVLQMSWAVWLVIGLLLLFVGPAGNQKSRDLRDSYLQRSDLLRVTPGQFQTSSNGNRVFFVERESSDGINARNVFILNNQPKSEAVTSAKSGRLEFDGSDRFLVLEQGQRNEMNRLNGEKTLSSFEGYRVLAGERAARDSERRPPKTLPSMTLLRDPTPGNQGELAWRFGMWLAAANLLLLGIGLSASNPRRASNWNLLFALLGFVVYFNLITLSQSWVASGRFSLASTLAGLHGGLFLLGCALIWWRDHAAVFVLWRRRARGAGA